MEKLENTVTAFMHRIGSTIDTLVGRTATSDMARELTSYIDGDREEDLDLKFILK